MSEKTGISWCDSTANAVIGCDKISPGCKNCYAANDTPARVLRHRGIETWGNSGQRVPVKGFEKSMLAMNRKPIICDHCGTAQRGAVAMDEGCENQDCPSNLHEHIQGSYHRRRVFCDSNSDWLDEKWPIESLAHFLDVCRRCPDIILILCTKRPENFWKQIKSTLGYVMDLPGGMNPDTKENALWWWLEGWQSAEKIPSNIILLTSVENQAMADKRIPELLAIPAACRGLSLEPLLGPVDLDLYILPTIEEVQAAYRGHKCTRSIDWLIIGGESGANARPCNVDWIRSLVQQGKAAGVATFVKQLGAKPEGGKWQECVREMGNFGRCDWSTMRDKKGGDIAEFPADLRVREWPTGL